MPYLSFHSLAVHSVPLEGFGSMQGMSGVTRFNIHKAGGSNSLPTAHTCFNQLDLPGYHSYEQFVKMLRVAFTQGLTGFAGTSPPADRGAAME
ncbi:E3 ubiquitin-protein ligase tom1 [Rhodosporidiobolus nylandii]